MDFFSTFIFSIALGVGIFGVTHLIRKNKILLNYYLAAGFFFLSYILFYFWAVRTGLIRYVPLLVYSDICATFFTAPTVYLVFGSIMREDRGPITRYRIHYVFPVLMTLCFLVYNIVKYPQIPELLNSRFDHYRTPLIFSLSLLSDLSLFGYILYSLIHAFLLKKRGEVERKQEFRIIFFFLAFFLVFSLFLLLSYIVRIDANIMIITAVFGLIMLVYSIVCFRIPEYSQGLILKKKSRQMLLDNNQQEYIISKLNKMMEDEQLFRDADLTVSMLARKLSLTSNAVSQLVNMKTGMNFRNYVNSFRLTNIKKDLISNPEKSVLEIAFDNGFNSKSSFNMLFRENTGLSPREYRLKMIN